MATVDMELKKHFEELQMQMGETRAKMRQMDSQIELLSKAAQSAEITKKEVSKLPVEGINTYESVGRMFVLRPVPQISAMLEDKAKSATEKIKTLKSGQEYLEKSLKERQDNLRELIIQKQQKQTTSAESK